MEIFIHAENFDGDSMDFVRCAVTVQLPALPRKGDTLFLSKEHAKHILRNILTEKSLAQRWCNLICQWGNDRPFMSLQGYFYVKDVWFNTDNGGSVHVLVGSDEREHYHEVTDSVFADLQESFKNGEMYY